MSEEDCWSQGALRPAPSSSKVRSPSIKLYLSLTASCAASLPNVSWKNIASVQVSSLIGEYYARKPVFMAGCSEKLGGPNKIVEVDESQVRSAKVPYGTTC